MRSVRPHDDLLMVGSGRQRAVVLIFIGAALVIFGLYGITHPVHSYAFMSRHLFLGSVLVIAGAVMFVVGLLQYLSEPKP